MRSFIIPRSFSSFEIGASRSLIESQGGRVMWTDRKVGTVVTCPEHVADILELTPRGTNPPTSGRISSTYEVELETENVNTHHVMSMQNLMDVSADDTVGELSF